MAALVKCDETNSCPIEPVVFDRLLIIYLHESVDVVDDRIAATSAKDECLKKSNHNSGVFRDGQFILSKETVQSEKMAIFAPEKCEIAADFANYAKETHIREENAFAAKHQ